MRMAQHLKTEDCWIKNQFYEEDSYNLIRGFIYFNQ